MDSMFETRKWKNGKKIIKKIPIERLSKSQKEKAIKILKVGLKFAKLQNLIFKNGIKIYEKTA